MPSTKKSDAKGGARATIDHDEIRAWAEEHGGTPATVKRTRRGDTAGIIRIDFPGYSGENSLEPIPWGEFFEKFEESKLALLLQDRTASGSPSRFNKFVSRDTVEVAPTEEASDDGPKSRRTTKTRRKSPQTKPSSAKRVAKPQSRTPARGTLRGSGATRKARDTSTRNSGKKTQRSTDSGTQSQSGPAKRTQQSTRKKTTTRRSATAKKTAPSAMRHE